jgi:hypothetical protein
LLRAHFLAIDENGHRLFAITSSDGTPQQAASTIVQLAAVPLGIGTISPTTVASAGGASLTIRRSGFQNATTLAINGKTASVTIRDANTLLVTTSSFSPGLQQIVITNPDREFVSLDAATTANEPALSISQSNVGPAFLGGPLFAFLANGLTFSRYAHPT